jgi:hypothetical protein
MQQYIVGLSPSSSCTLSNDIITSNVDMDDDATSTNAGPNDELEQQSSPHHPGGGVIPIEYQTYEVDEVTMSRMDPLEYTFRKYIPIPRVYFWDTAVTSINDQHDLPRRIKLWHYTIYYLGEGLRIAEKGGEVVANVLGLNDGPFNYVTSGMTPEEMVASRAMMDERRQQRVELEDMTNNDEGGGV